MPAHRSASQLSRIRSPRDFFLPPAPAPPFAGGGGSMAGAGAMFWTGMAALGAISFGSQRSGCWEPPLPWPLLAGGGSTGRTSTHFCCGCASCGEARDPFLESPPAPLPSLRPPLLRPGGTAGLPPPGCCICLGICCTWFLCGGVSPMRATDVWPGLSCHISRVSWSSAPWGASWMSAHGFFGLAILLARLLDWFCSDGPPLPLEPAVAPCPPLPTALGALPLAPPGIGPWGICGIWP
mmetsp:Transcript_66796/g.184992  ORF Transcript_66796/g.184992 Transcript_66796/m.184992 type:complete len:238 (-) Transcript_66796:1132-1845(-)